MASEKTILIQGTEDLARGEMDNVTLDGGAVVLEQAEGRYVLFGCYTTPAFSVPVSGELLVSWNADTPEGTVVEIQARVLAHDEWSGWLGFGKWSPYLQRQGVWQEPASRPYVQGGRLIVPTQNAISVQLRAYLYTNDEGRTPALRLLAVSARPRVWQKQEGKPLNREIRMPSYSQLNRAPVFKGQLSGPTTLAALMNRFGQDILPEELALVCQDWAPETKWENAAFDAAAAGCYGYPAWQAWLDLAGLKEEIRQGNPVMARVDYAGSPEEETDGLPWIEGVTGTAHHHWLAIRGFEHDEDKKEEYVLVCDPLSGTDYGAERQYRLEGFLKAFSGACLLTRRRPRDSGKSAPERLCCELRSSGEEGCYFFYREATPLPLPPREEEPPTEKQEGEQPAYRPVREILACTFQEEKAYATTAHKHFRFDLTATGEGAIRLPEAIREKGKRITVYAIDASGRMKVAERTL